jgi:hypothetical protein
MQNVTDYRVLHFGVSQLDVLSNAVKDYIANGWQPSGDTNMAHIDNQQVFVQAMVKYDK